MRPDDLDAVVEAEQRCHEFPWTRGNFADSLAAGHGAWLAREDGRMTGYAVMMRAPDESHLLNITILPDLQRGGRGSALLAYLFEEARTWGAARMLLEVRPGNASGLGAGFGTRAAPPLAGLRTLPSPPQRESGCRGITGPVPPPLWMKRG